ncbi:beta strand repeat-containing protein, partial [Acinetobacter piscicola]|uniref:beta strand repeat-containing protein n=1 Tax=Acinetobacter piscicola TaxID=2006115 RepID=UPI0038990C9C
VLTSTANGLDVGGDKITNVANATAASDAVNKGQLDSVVNAGFKVGGNTNPAGGAVTHKLGNQLDIVASAKDATKTYDTSNLTTEVAQDAAGKTTVTVSMKKDATFDSITAGTGTDKTVLNKDGLTVTEGTDNTVIGATSVSTKQVTVGDATNNTVLTSTANGLNVGGDKISGLAAGDISSAASTDAVNGGQLFTTNTNVTNLQNQTWKLQANGDTASAVKSSDTVQFLDGTNIKVTRGGNNITIATNPNLTVDSVTAGTGTDKTVLNKDGLTVTEGTDNTVIGATSVSTKQVTVGDATNNTVLTSTANGLDVGGDKITNVANATAASDAVNKGQLDSVVNAGFKVGGNTNPAGGAVTHKLGNQLDIVASAKDATKTYDTSNLTTEVAQDAAGKTTVTVSMKKDATFDSITAGTGTDKTVLNKDGLTVTEGTDNTVIGATSVSTKQVTVGDATNNTVLTSTANGLN